MILFVLSKSFLFFFFDLAIRSEILNSKVSTPSHPLFHRTPICAFKFSVVPTLTTTYTMKSLPPPPTQSSSSPSIPFSSNTVQRIEKRKRGRPRKELPVIQFPVQWEFHDNTASANSSRYNHHRSSVMVSSHHTSSSQQQQQPSIQIFNYYHDEASKLMQYCNVSQTSSSTSPTTTLESSFPTTQQQSVGKEISQSNNNNSSRQVYSFQYVNFPRHHPTPRKRSNSGQKSDNSSPSKSSFVSPKSSSNSSLRKSPIASTPLSPISRTIWNTSSLSTSPMKTTTTTTHTESSYSIAIVSSPASAFSSSSATPSVCQRSPSSQIQPSHSSGPIASSWKVFDPAQTPTTAIVSSTSTVPSQPQQQPQPIEQQSQQQNEESFSSPQIVSVSTLHAQERRPSSKGRTHISLKDILN